MFHMISKEHPSEEFLNQIIDNIKKGNLKPGDSLPTERALSETLGISRPVVREVLKSLELLGIITSVHGGGNYISKNLETCLIKPLSILFEINNSSLIETQQLRAALECKAAELAAEKCTPVDAAELKLTLEKINAATTPEDREKLDHSFHMDIARVAGNRMIYNILAASSKLNETIIGQVQSYTEDNIETTNAMNAEHKTLIECIATHDKENAILTMQKHLAINDEYIDQVQREYEKKH